MKSSKNRIIECVRYYNQFESIINKGIDLGLLDEDAAKQFEAMSTIVYVMAKKEGIDTDDINSEPDLTLDEYQSRAMTTCMPSSHNISYMVYGLCEESGEVAGKISKAIRKGLVEIDNNRLTYINTTEEKIEEFDEALKKELGDVAWMLAGACSVMGWKLSEICNGNLDKLSDRQKRNVIDGSGDTR